MKLFFQSDVLPNTVEPISDFGHYAMLWCASVQPRCDEKYKYWYWLVQKVGIEHTSSARNGFVEEFGRVLHEGHTGWRRNQATKGNMAFLLGYSLPNSFL